MLIASIVPRPSSFCHLQCKKLGGGLTGRISHVMRAAADVTDSADTYSQYSTCCYLFQRCSETIQTPDEKQVLHIYNMKHNR